MEGKNGNCALSNLFIFFKFFSVGFQKFKNMEENFLGFGAIGQKLNVVDDQYIHQLIKVDQIVDGIVLDGLDDLVGKFFDAYIEYRLIGAIR